jgi:ABC-type spermidine/putrescine transport system permease subunit II
VTFGLGLWTVLVYIFLFLPISFVVIHSFTDSRDFTRWGGFTTHWYTRLLDNHELKNALANSIKVAIVATLISVVLGGLAGIALARRPGVWTKVFLALVFLILVTPEIVDASGSSVVRQREHLPSGSVPTVVRAVDLQLSGSTLIIARPHRADESLEEAAGDAATPARFRQILCRSSPPRC